ncbi:MAG: hypothetical protein RQ758_09085, partial [Methanomicrobiaceae archaeon]|nr:hypothetical protein [Methanomicrobiaceae archaeon]
GTAGPAWDEESPGKSVLKQNRSSEETGTGKPDEIALKKEERVQEKADLKEEIEARRQALDRESENLGAAEQKVQRNQNAVKLAVHSLLAAQKLGAFENSPGVGEQVSEFTRYFNNSVQASIRAEEKIEQRSSFLRFLAGGDKEAAGELQQMVIENRARIREMKRLIEDCGCDSETKQVLQEQLAQMEQEQTRLEEQAADELGSKGLLGWMWK